MGKVWTSPCGEGISLKGLGIRKRKGLGIRGEEGLALWAVDHRLWTTNIAFNNLY
jgi:hypothetical protein